MERLTDRQSRVREFKGINEKDLDKEVDGNSRRVRES